MDPSSINHNEEGHPMIYVGIDVSKDKHDCYIVNSDGEVLKDVFTIQNTESAKHDMRIIAARLFPPTFSRVSASAEHLCSTYKKYKRKAAENQGP